MGLVSSVVSRSELHETAHELAALVARGPRDALARTKAKALRRVGHAPDTGTLEL